MPNRPKAPAPLPDQRTPTYEPTDLRVLPRDLGALFAERPLIQGESEADYDLLLSKVTQAVEPTDMVEAVRVKDYTDLTWDTERLKRLKAGLLMAARKKAIDRLHAETSGPHLGVSEPLTAGYTKAWLQGEPEAIEKFNRLLAARGLDLNSIMAVALSESLGDIERIDRMIASNDARRHRILVEIEQRREAKARQRRTLADEVTTVSWRDRGPNQR